MHPRHFDIPAPADENVFMQLCAEVWRKEWRTDTVQINGRRGQKQQGVDILGRPNDGSDWCAIQCKARSHQGAKLPKLTAAEIREEVSAATFVQPPLKHLIVATTAPHDEEAQQIARGISEQHAKLGLFSVDVLGWSEIRRRMDRYPELHDWYQSLGPLEHRLEKGVAEVQQGLASVLAALKSGNTNLARTLVEAQLTAARQLIKTHRPNAAIVLLESIFNASKDSIDSILTYRILSNLGNAKLLLSQFEAAGRHYLEAAQYAPDDDIARAQHAHGHLLLQDIDAAAKTAREGFGIFPKSGRLQALLIGIAFQRDRNLDLETLIPPQFADDHHVAFTVAHLFEHVGKSEAAAKWIKISRSSDMTHWETQKSHARLLLHWAVGSTAFIYGRSGDLRADFDVAAAELEKIWEVIADGEPIDASANITAQLAIARDLQGNNDGARDICKIGLAMGNPPLLMRIAARLAEKEHRYDEAESYYHKIQPSDLSERDFLLAEAQLNAGRSDDAVATLTSSLLSMTDQDLKFAARARILEIRSEREKVSDILPDAIALIDAEPEVVIYRVAAASLLIKSGNRDEAISHANAALALLTATSSVGDKATVADVLFNLECYDEAAAIYTELSPDPVDSAFGRQLLLCLYNADKRSALRTRLDLISKEQKDDPFYLWIEAALLERIGELNEATKLLEAYLAHRPDDAHAQLHWINFLERLQRTKQLVAFLDATPDLSKGTDFQKVKYAHVLQRHGYKSRALELAYDVARKNRHDPQVQLAYLGLVLVSAPFDPFDVAAIGSDCAFTIEPIEGGASHSYVVETNPRVDRIEEIPPTHPIAMAVAGKLVGDEAEISEGPYNIYRVTITSVRHKYLARQDDILENFNRRFPSHTGLFRIPILTLPDGVTDFSQMFQAIDDRYEHQRSITSLYSEQQLPLPVIAKLLGEHPIRAWGHISVGGEAGVKSCEGNVSEREEARKLLRASDAGFAFDPISLNLLHELNLTDVLVNLDRPLFVTQSVCESIEVLIQETSLHRDGIKTLGKEGDRYVWQEIPSGNVAAYVRNLHALLGWIDSHCKKVPAIADADFPPEARQLAQAIDRSFIDVIHAARGHNLLLVSDDLYFRRLAQLLGVNGTWLQPVLDLAVEKGAMTKSAYSETLERLVSLNHGFVSIDASVLLHIVGREKWSVTPRFTKMISRSCASDVEIQSCLVVLIEFLRHVFQPGISPKKRRTIFGSVLRALENGHPGSAERIRRILSQVADRMFEGNEWSVAQRRQEWKEGLNGWASTLHAPQDSNKR